MDFRIDWSDCKSLSNYKNAGPVILDEMTKAMTRSQLMVETTAKQLVPVDTGRLRSAIGHEPVQAGGDTIVGRVGVKGVIYARMVEFGTAAHDIVAKGRALAFMWNGQQVFFKSVHHPGTRPKPYLIPGVERNLGRINAEFGKVGGRVLARLGKR